MEDHFGVVSASSRLDKFAQIVSEQTAISCFLVENNDIVGVITKEAALGVLDGSNNTTMLGEIANKDYITVPEDMTLFEVIAEMRSSRAAVALVTRDGRTASAENVEGLITKERIADAVVEAIELFSD